jgi:hypothetical protein
VFLLCFHCRNMYFWYISNVYKNTHVTNIIHEMHSFASVFMCFHCVFSEETYTFDTFNMYTKIHMYHILYMKCTVFLVFSQFHCRNMYFWYISHVYKNTHVPYIMYEIHSFASVFIVYLLQKHLLLVHFTCIQTYSCTIYNTWNAEFC